MLSYRSTVLLAVAVLAGVSSAQAHFLWIAPDSSPKERRVHVYFSETAEPDDPELLSRLTGLKLQEISSDDKLHVLDLARDENSLVANPAGTETARSYSLNHTYGLHRRDGEDYLLVYHGRMYPAVSTNKWIAPPTDQQLPLELVPTFADGRLVVRVLWQGKPLDAAELKVNPAGTDAVDAKSDAAGQFSLSASRPGLYAFRAKYVENRTGERDGKKYASIRHYSTLVVTVTGDRPAGVKEGKVSRTSKKTVAGAKRMKRPMLVASSKKKHSAGGHALPDLPFGITSFGAALIGHNVYICDGQLGPAHEYSVEGQSDRLLRLDLKAPRQWEVVGTVPRRSGLAMVTFEGKAYRIGGFEARNKKGEPDDLHSTRDFSRFDPATGHWEDLAPLPQGRSSHDAVMVGSRLYVVGGWELRGSEPSVWHDTALQIDLASAQLTWTELPKQPFHRRALSLGEYRGKLYALGGIQEKGGLTTTSDVLDLASGKWFPGPKLPGEGLEGFGGCAVTCAGRLYATTYSGKLSRLSEDGREWQAAGQLARPRFFHRMLCRDDSSFIVVGGANMEEGKDLSVEVIPVTLGQTAHR